MDSRVCPDESSLRDYLSGNVSTDLRQHLNEHLQECPACQSTVDALSNTPMVQEAGESVRLDQYELLEQIGEGGMGTVYKARHLRLNQIVAVKVLREDLHQNPEVASRFHREMEVLGRLDHPNIVRAADAGEAGGVHYLVTEFVDGVDLGQLVDTHGPLPVADACEIIRQAALGLQHAHELGLVHRDIKPANLMITPDGHVKLLDLGLARLQGEQSSTADLTAAGQVLGTLDYMAPEQTDNVRAVDIRSDIYSLGCTLYKLLTGQAPFAGAAYNTPVKKTIGHALRNPPALGKFRTDVPDGVSAVLDRMLAKEPRDRHATPAELADALAPFAAGCNLTRLPVLLTATPGAEADTAGETGTTDRQASVAADSADTVTRWSRPMIAAVGVLVLIGGAWFAASKLGSDAKEDQNRNATASQTAASSSSENDNGGPPTDGLFNGRDLTNWVAMRSFGPGNAAHSPAPDADDWIVRDGVMICNTATAGWLKSERKYGDFVLELDFRLPPHGNSGVYLRSPDQGRLSAVGMEIQMIEESTWGSELRPEQRTGAIFGIASPSESVQKPVGEWNTMQMRCEGETVQVTLNGTMIVDATVAASQRPQAGFVGITNWNGEGFGAEFRNFRIRELSPLVPSLPPEFATPWTNEEIPAVLVPDPAKIPGVHRWQMDTIYPRGAFRSVAWHPTKPLIACATHPGQLRVYDADDGTLTQLLIDTHKHHLIRNIAWSPDGRLLATARNKGISVWDTETWKQSQITGGGAVAWSPDGSRLVVPMAGRNARICTLDNETEVEFDVGGVVEAIAWSPDERLIAFGGKDGNVTTWEFDGLPGPLLERVNQAAILSISFNHDSTLIATSSNDGVGYFSLDGSAARLEPSLAVNSVSCNPHHNVIAIPSWNGDVQIRNVDGTIGPLLKAPPQPHSEPWTTRFAWDPTGEWIAVGCVDTGLRVWKSDGSSQRTISGPAASTYSVDWNSQAGLILAAGNDYPLRAWDIEGRAIGGIGDIQGLVKQCVWSPDGSQIAAVCSDDTVRLLSRDGTPGAVIDSANVACWHPSDDAVIVADPVGTVRIHSTDGSELAVLGEHPYVYRLAANPKHNLVASAATDQTICLWNLDDSTKTVLEGRAAFYFGMAWSEDGEWLATAESGRNVGLWRKDGTIFPALNSKTTSATCCWLPTNKLLTAVFAYPNRIDIVNPIPELEVTLEPTPGTPANSTFIGHPAVVLSMDAVEPGGRFVSCSTDNTIRLWNVESGKEEWIAVMLPEGKSVTIDRAGHILSMDHDAEKHLVYIVERELGKPELMSFEEFHELAGPEFRNGR